MPVLLYLTVEELQSIIEESWIISEQVLPEEAAVGSVNSRWQEETWSGGQPVPEHI